jgi:hypothetical protein
MTARPATDAISEKHLSGERSLRSVDQMRQVRDAATRAQTARLRAEKQLARRKLSDKR